MAPSQTIQCPRCKEPVQTGAHYCSGCGVNLQAKRPITVPAGDTPLQVPKVSRTQVIIGSVAAAVVCFLPILAIWGASHSVSARGFTVEEYLQLERQKLETQLNITPNEFGKHIEKIHLTVTYKGGHVKSMTATTVDGSNNAGKDGSNIAEMDVIIVAYWDGYVQKNGFTEMELVYDNLGNRLKSSKYLDSNALVNIETVDWIKVGWVVGSWLSYVKS